MCTRENWVWEEQEAVNTEDFHKIKIFFIMILLYTHTHTSILNLHLMLRFTMELDVFGDKIFLLI